MVIAEADNGRSPHFGFAACDILHDLHEFKAILPLLIGVRKSSDEFVNVCRCVVGFVFCHNGLIIDAYHKYTQWVRYATIACFQQKSRLVSNETAFKFFGCYSLRRATVRALPAVLSASVRKQLPLRRQ